MNHTNYCRKYNRKLSILIVGTEYSKENENMHTTLVSEIILESLEENDSQLAFITQ